MAYATASDLANHLGRALTSQETALAPTLIDAAQGYIDRRCGRTFELTAGNTNLTKYFDTGYYVDEFVDPFNLAISTQPGNRFVYIEDCLALTSPTDANGNHSVSLLTEQGTVSGTLYQGTDFITYPLDATERAIGFNSLYRVGISWPAGRRTISVQGNWGYSATAPSGVATAAALMVCLYLRNKQHVVSESIEGYSVDWFRTSGAGEVLNQRLEEIVDEYCPKRVRVYA